MNWSPDIPSKETQRIAMRSPDSLRFQELWASFRKEGELIPERAVFRPEKMRYFLPTMLIAQVSEDGHRLDIRLAGTTIREYIGFELTGKNFLDFDASEGPGNGPSVRLHYHDWPCGRFERLGVLFKHDLRVETDITLLPMWGPEKERHLLIYAEPSQVSQLDMKNAALLEAQNAIYSASIDIGNGIPPYDKETAPLLTPSD